MHKTRNCVSLEYMYIRLIFFIVIYFLKYNYCVTQTVIKLNAKNILTIFTRILVDKSLYWQLLFW